MRLDVLSLRMELRLLVQSHTHVVKRLTSLRKRSAKAVGYLISPSHKLPRNTQISSGVVSEVLVEPLKLCDLGLLHLVMDKLLLHLALLLVRNSNGRWLLNSALKVHVHIHVDVHADILVLTGLINVLGWCIRRRLSSWWLLIGLGRLAWWILLSFGIVLNFESSWRYFALFHFEFYLLSYVLNLHVHAVLKIVVNLNQLLEVLSWFFRLFIRNFPSIKFRLFIQSSD